MRKLHMADSEIMRIAIQQEIARSDESRYDHRLHGLLLVTGGRSCRQGAELFGEDRRTVQRWVKRLEAHGLEGLREGERPGRPSALGDKQWAALGRDVRRNPLLRHRSCGKRMVVMLDHARDHHAVLLASLLRRYRTVLTLWFLPPDSPQLAPIERVWKLARRVATHNRFFATLDELLCAVETCFDRWRKPNSVWRRLCGII